MVFGIVLNRHGWRVTHLGMNTPVTDLRNAVQLIRADLVVFAATAPRWFSGLESDLRELAGLAPLAFAGAGATRERVGARLLAGDPVTEAEQIRVPA